MIFIEHRKNTLADLKTVTASHGIEIDVRSNSSELILTHDAFTSGESLTDWLEEFTKRKSEGPLVLNTKEDGLEDAIVKLLGQHGISRFLFLDTAFPTFVKYSQTDLAKHFMMRLSAHEPLAMAKPFAGRTEWLWVDCFDGVPLNEAILQEAKKHFKLCMVSPELQKRDLKKHFSEFKKIEKYFSAICTKHPDFWLS